MLVSFSLWHRLACLDPWNLLADTHFIWFFGDRMQWVPRGALYRPNRGRWTRTGTFGSEGAAFHLRFVQRLLLGPKDLVWRPLARSLLHMFNGLGLHNSLFLMDLKTLKLQTLPVFCWVHSVEPAGEGEGSAGSILLLVAETVHGVSRLVGRLLLGRTDRNTSVLQSGMWILTWTMHLLKQLLGVKSVRVINKLLGHWNTVWMDMKCSDGLIEPLFLLFVFFLYLTDILLFHTENCRW